MNVYGCKDDIALDSTVYYTIASVWNISIPSIVTHLSLPRDLIHGIHNELALLIPCFTVQRRADHRSIGLDE